MSSIKKYYAWREKYLQLAADSVKNIYIRVWHPGRQPWQETTNTLRRYDYGTIANQLYYFLKSGEIELEPKYESHDIYHILSGYGLGIVNEARLFFFLFGNGKKSPSIVGSILIALVFMPDQWSTFRSDYQKGKRYHPIYKIDYREILELNFIEFRASLEKKL